MSAGKKKALASELIDDLLNDDEMQASKVESKAKKSKKKSSKESSKADDSTVKVRDKTEVIHPDSDKTIAINQGSEKAREDSSPFDMTSVGTVTKSSRSRKSPTPVVSDVGEESLLRSANSLYIAQQKILDLESEIERL